MGISTYDDEIVLVFKNTWLSIQAEVCITDSGKCCTNPYVKSTWSAVKSNLHMYCDVSHSRGYVIQMYCDISHFRSYVIQMYCDISHSRSYVMQMYCDISHSRSYVMQMYCDISHFRSVFLYWCHVSVFIPAHNIFLSYLSHFGLILNDTNICSK